MNSRKFSIIEVWPKGVQVYGVSLAELDSITGEWRQMVGSEVTDLQFAKITRAREGAWGGRRSWLLSKGAEMMTRLWQELALLGARDVLPSCPESFESTQKATEGLEQDLSAFSLGAAKGISRLERSLGRGGGTSKHAHIILQ